MKKVFVFCVLLALWLTLDGSSVWAVDVGWMKKGVRAWYFGGVGSTGTSDAEEAYLFSGVNGTNVQVTKHSGINHWGTPNPVDTSTYSFLGKGPCWIHPQVLQTLQSGDTWKGQVIATVLPESHTYDTFKAQFSFPYLLLPIKALFDLQAQRNLVKIVYYIQGSSTGIAYFDADTGLLLLYETSNGFVTVFFLLSEINYDFATQRAFAEDNGPHTGFKSFVSEAQLMAFPDTRGGTVVIQSSVESRYGSTVEMWVSTSDSGNISSYLPPFENYCFFGSVPVLRHIDMTQASNYRPDQWNPYGQYLWWWVPTGALQNSTINVFNVPMTKTSTNPYTFTATQQLAGLFFSKLWFDNDGYMTQFSAKDSNTGLDIDPERSASYYQNLTTVNGLAYYKNTMGRATPAKIEMIDFDGDGKTDLAIYRKSTGAWFYISSSTHTPAGAGFGGDPSDIPVPGDYDGDGKTDYAIYRLSTGAWFIYPSKTWVPYGVGFGGDASDKPVPGDYDGDGKTDLAIYRKSIGAWFIYPSSTGAAGIYGVGFGGDASDIPVPADYDGDGKTDLAIYRKSTGAWFIYPSSTGAAGIYGVGFGGDTSDIPVPADYDGDGKTDLAIYRKSIGAWFIYPSKGGAGAIYGVGFGGDTSDIPVPGDYDGDGKADLAIYRASIGAWFIYPSSTGPAGIYGVGFGGDASDQPVITNPGSYM